MSERDDLARVIAAGLESSIEDTALALAVGTKPTDVDYELADLIMEVWLKEHDRAVEARAHLDAYGSVNQVGRDHSAFAALVFSQDMAIRLVKMLHRPESVSTSMDADA